MTTYSPKTDAMAGRIAAYLTMREEELAELEAEPAPPEFEPWQTPAYRLRMHCNAVRAYLYPPASADDGPKHLPAPERLGKAMKEAIE